MQQMQVTAKKLLLLVLRDESSRALFEFLHILPTSYMCVCEEICVVSAVHGIAAAQDSAHVNKQKGVQSGVSLRGGHCKCLPPFRFIKFPLQREGIPWLGERAT